MTRTIILIPVGKNSGFTSVILSFIYFLRQKKYKVLFFDSCTKNRSYNKENSTSYITNKYFLSPFIQFQQNYKKIFFSSELEDEYFIEKFIQNYLLHKSFYDFILIEGVFNNHKKYGINDINLKLANHLKAEIIFISSNIDYVKFLISKEKIFEKYDNLKNYFMGFIINNIIVDYRKIHIYNISKTINIKKKKNIDYGLFPVIANIPWNEHLINLPIKKIFKYLQVNIIQKKNNKIDFINSFTFYNDLILKSKKKYNNSILIIPMKIFIKKNNDEFLNLFHNLCFKFILLTNFNFSGSLKKNIFINFLHISIDIFYTFLDITTVLFILQNFKLNIIQKKKFQIQNVQCYISNFLNKDKILSFNNSVKKNNFFISPFMFRDNINNIAKKLNKRILLPEGNNPRIIQSACIVSNLGLARCILLGDIHEIKNIASSLGIIIPDNIEILNPKLISDNYIDKLYKIRYLKGISKKDAKLQIINSNMVLASLMLINNEVDGIVCGVKYTTAEVLRSAFQIIGVYNNNFNSLVSSIFFILLEDRVLVYGDCAININPNAEQLSTIAIQSADLSKLFGITPRIAMLSYSTGNSGYGKTVDKVRKATFLVKKNRPDLIIEGPIQYDASVNKFICNIKDPLSLLNGEATVFVFPDLNSGNITYKAIQHSANAISIGPILQGLRKPVNDLSRGASVNDIIYTIAITAIQSKEMN